MGKPRRKIIITAKIEADDWNSVKAAFRHFETEIAMYGELPKSSVSGGYSSGWILVSDVDGNMTHDQWAADLNAWLEAQETPRAEA